MKRAATTTLPLGLLREAYRHWLDLLRLQIGDRWVLFLVADSVLLVAGIFNALLGEGDAAAPSCSAFRRSPTSSPWSGTPAASTCCSAPRTPPPTCGGARSRSPA